MTRVDHVSCDVCRRTLARRENKGLRRKIKKDGHQHEPPLRPTRGHYEFIRKLICRLSVVTKVNCVKIPYNTEEDVWIIKTRKEIR